MKVLVTGATGGLGRLVVTQLLKLGHEVVGTSRSIEKAKKFDFFNQITFISYDINQPLKSDLYSYFGKPDAVIHLAWEKLDDYKHLTHLTTILKNHKLFVSNLIKHGLKNVIGIGTCYEYGLIEGELCEDMDVCPTLSYAQAKHELRLFIESLVTTHAFAFKWVRIFYVFGEMAERKNLYTSLKQAIRNGDKVFNMSGGEQVRDFLNPNEVAKNIVDITLQEQVQGIVNCCSGKPIKIKDAIEKFLTENQHDIDLNLGYYPYSIDEPMKMWGATTKLNTCKK